MAARVIGDQAIAPLYERARALYDVTARGRQPVEKHNRRPFAEDLALEREAPGARNLAQNLKTLCNHRPTLWRKNRRCG